MAFADPGAVLEGWLWVAASGDVKRGRVMAVEIAGRKLALYRGADGVARAVDAFCPHMGAHLALGRVEGDALRCFFHGWRFDRDGRCAEIPALEGQARPEVCVRSHELHEEDGLIWIWVGDGAASFLPPIHQALRRVRRRRALLVARWRKRCHPNVVLVNAIDEQHFRTVHNVPGEALKLEPESVAPHHFRVTNSGAPPKTSLLWRFVAMLYRGEAMTYEIDYYSGATGCVRLGPSWARLYLMFAARPAPDGGTAGVTVAVTPRHAGLFGPIVDWCFLGVAALAGAYFAVGDTKVFNSIRFELKTPIPADRTVLAYVRHVEAQKRAHLWSAEAAPRLDLAAE